MTSTVSTPSEPRDLSRLADLALVGGLAGWSAAQWWVGEETGFTLTEASRAISVGVAAVLVVTQVAPLLVRRRWPVLAAAAALLTFLAPNVIQTPPLPSNFAVLAAGYALGRHLRRHLVLPVALVGAAVVVGFVIAVQPVRSTLGPLFTLALLVILAVPVVIGVQVRRVVADRDDLRRQVAESPPATPPHSASTPLVDWPSLSSREREVLELLAGGLSNAEIATRLRISHETVKSHVARILAKTGARDRTQAAILAVRDPWPGAAAGVPSPE
ncbi:MAG: helix-turn-helix domain-containing protein [Phycicoccus sp.]